jgi:DNA-binding MarR family transcriptional regulator
VAKPNDREIHPLAAVPSIAEVGPVSFSIFRLARAHRALAALLLRKIGLHPGQEFLLMHLLDRDGLDQNELVKLIGFDPSTGTKMLQRLESEGFLTRKRSSHDKRAMTVHLTAKGKELRVPLTNMWAELEHGCASAMSDSQKKAAVDMLGRFERSICDME